MPSYPYGTPCEEARSTVMGLQPVGKVPDLRRLAGRAASRSTVHWSWLRIFLGFCLLPAVMGGLTVGLPHAHIAAAFPETPSPPAGLARLPHTIPLPPPPPTPSGPP